MTGGPVRTTTTSHRPLSALLAVVAAGAAVYLGRRHDAGTAEWALGAGGVVAGAAFSRLLPRRSSWGLSVLLATLAVVSDLAFDELPSARTALVLAFLAGASAVEARAHRPDLSGRQTPRDRV